MGMQDTLHALADPTRREILNLLKQSRLSAGEISNHFSISGAAISRHLSVLKDADLIYKNGGGNGPFVTNEKENLSITNSMLPYSRKSSYGSVN